MHDDTLTRPTEPSGSSGRSSSVVDVDEVFPRPSALTAWSVRSVAARTFAGRLTLALLTGIGLFLMTVWIGPLYNSLEDSLVEMSESLGDGVMSVFGDFGTPAGFLSAEVYSLFAPALLVFVALSSSAMAFAEDEEDRHIGLLAANPIGRRRLGAEKSLAVFAHTTLVAVLTGAGTWVGVQVGSLDIPTAHVAAMTLHFALFGGLVAATAMLVAVLLGRKVPSMVVTAGLVLVAYVWGSFAPQSDVLEPYAAISPWYWYFGEDPLTDGVAWGYAGLLLAAALAVLAVALRRFETKDLAG